MCMCLYPGLCTTSCVYNIYPPVCVLVHVVQYGCSESPLTAVRCAMCDKRAQSTEVCICLHFLYPLYLVLQQQSFASHEQHASIDWGCKQCNVTTIVTVPKAGLLRTALYSVVHIAIECAWCLGDCLGM
eukprot:scpid102526/ scgid15078/ 